MKNNILKIVHFMKDNNYITKEEFFSGKSGIYKTYENIRAFKLADCECIPYISFIGSILKSKVIAEITIPTNTKIVRPNEYPHFKLLRTKRLYIDKLQNPHITFWNQFTHNCNCLSLDIYNRTYEEGKLYAHPLDENLNNSYVWHNEMFFLNKEDAEFYASNKE